MKKIFSLAALALCLCAGANGTQLPDTLLTSDGHKIVYNAEGDNYKVTLLNKDGTEQTKLNETTYTREGQEVEQTYISSPFLAKTWKNIGKRRHRDFEGHIPLIFYGLNFLCCSPFSYNANANLHAKNSKSYEIGVNLVTFSLPFNYSRTVGLSVGLGWVYKRLYFKDDYSLYNDDGQSIIAPIREFEGSANKSYISYHAMRLPIMVEWHPFTRKSLFAGMGVSVEFRNSEHSRYKGFGHTVTPTKDINLNTAGVNFEAYVGSEYFMFRMSAGLTPLLNSDVAPKCYTASFGLGVNL